MLQSRVYHMLNLGMEYHLPDVGQLGILEIQIIVLNGHVGHLKYCVW